MLPASVLANSQTDSLIETQMHTEQWAMISLNNVIGKWSYKEPLDDTNTHTALLRHQAWLVRYLADVAVDVEVLVHANHSDSLARPFDWRNALAARRALRGKHPANEEYVTKK